MDARQAFSPSTLYRLPYGPTFLNAEVDIRDNPSKFHPYESADL
jgi:hypothetical protein